MNKNVLVITPAFLTFAICVLASLYVHFSVPPTWVEQKATTQAFINDQGQYYFLEEEEAILIDNVVPY